MGELNQHDLQHYIDKYGCKVFVETGTGIGTGLEYACGFPFEKLVSCEIMTPLYYAAINKFSGDIRTIIVNNSSITALGRMAYMFTNLYCGVPILFWLDAHFPGADFQLGKYDDEHPPEIKTPLEEELRIISQKRIGQRDVIIIDDLRCYEDGPFELGNFPDRKKYFTEGIQFVHDLFGHTHTITKDYRHQGFLILEPK